MPKVLRLIRSCGECSHYSSGQCTLADAPVHDCTVVPAFCPLNDYPGKVIADLEATLRFMQDERYQHALVMAVLIHIAAKLHKPMDARTAAIALLLEDERVIHLTHDSISAVDPHSWEITFLSKQSIFRLNINELPPTLLEQVHYKDVGDLWKACSIV